VIVAESHSDDLSVAERFGVSHDGAANSAISTLISSDHRDDFWSTSRVLQLGMARVYAMTYSPLEARRTVKLIRRSDPEQYQMSFTLRGTQRVAQVDRDTSLGPHDLILYDSSRPYDCHLIGTGDDTVAFTAVQIPKAQIPIPPERIDRLVAAGMSGRTGIGALLVQFLVRLTAEAHHYLPADAPRLGTVLHDLVVALLAHELDADSTVPPESHQRALTVRIQAFICQHIGEPELNPAMIAAAHHVSTRHLHRIFQSQGTTVAAWIRRQRLEGCRRDLADPVFRMTPLHEIAKRWGFSHPAAFSRAFRTAYGLSPRDHRHYATTDAALRNRF
jgi:AraC-like DNA-binding protein